MTVQVRRERMGGIFLWLLLTPFVLAAQTGGSPAPPQKDAEVQLHADLERAAEAMHKGELSAAAEAFRQALRIDPHSLAALNNLGIVLARQGKPAEAIPLYEEALKVRPGDPATERNLADRILQSPALPVGMESASADGGGASRRLSDSRLSGLCLFALDRYPEAATYLERANQAHPSDVETLDMLGKAYLRMKDYKALTNVFARIMQVNPNSASAHIMMATAYDEMSQRAEAIKEYQAAEKADPNFMGVHSGLGFAIGTRATPTLPRKNSAQNCSASPAIRSRTAFWRDSAHSSRNPRTPNRIFRAALAANPRYTEALFVLGKTEIALESSRSGDQPLRKAILINPNYARHISFWARRLRQMGQTPKRGRNKNCRSICRRNHDRGDQEE